MHIRNPVEWGVDQLRTAGAAIDALGHHQKRTEAAPAVRQIAVVDLREALVRGLDDFAEFRTDVVFIAVFYPLIGVVLARLVFGYDLLPLLFPLASGFALVGPVAAVGLYEMSRQRELGREAGDDVGWADALGVFRSPALASIILFGLVLMAIFLVWLSVAIALYDVTLGPDQPISLFGFARDLFTTQSGWVLVVAGIGIGFLFAVLVLAISVISVPLLLDRDCGLVAAVGASLRAVRLNPVPMALWGLIVAAGLVIGSIPLFLGLIIVMPVLGHATWHLYRRVIAP